MTNVITFEQRQQPKDTYRIDDVVTDMRDMLLIRFTNRRTKEPYKGAIAFFEMEDSGFKKGDIVHLQFDKQETATYMSPNDYINYTLIKRIELCSKNVVSFDGWKRLRQPQTRFKPRVG